MPTSAPEKMTKDIPLHDVSFDQNTIQGPDYTQEVQLIDISTTKTWMAYITKYQHERSLLSVENSTKRDDRYFLTISEFKGVDPNVRRYSYDITNAYYQDIPQTCMFLSISSDGTRVAISFANVHRIGFVRRSPVYNRKCLVFNVNEDRSVLKLDKAIKFQGRAVFSKNNDLMLVNSKVLKIYDKVYHEKTCFALRSLRTDYILHRKEAFSAMDYTLKPHWAWFNNTDDFNHLKTSEVKDIITMTRHIRRNILITPYKTKAQVWSITEKGVRLTSILKKEDEEIMAFSKNYKFLATFVDSTRAVNVYNVKSGLFLYKLTPQHRVADNRKFEVSCIRFCSKGRYLVMTGLERDTSDDIHKAVGYEVWHIESEQSIYSRNVDSQFSANSNHKTIAPFIMTGKLHTVDCTASVIDQSTINTANGTATPMLFANPYTDSPSSNAEDAESGTLEYTVSTLYVDYDSQCRNTFTRMESLNIYATSTDEAFHRDNESLQNKGWIKVASDLEDISGVSEPGCYSIHNPTLCFIRYYLDRVYLLQFGNYLIQLWCLPINTRISSIGEGENAAPDISGMDDLGELLFLHAYKAPYYGFTYTFRESWLVHQQENEENSKSKSIKFLQHQDIEIIDRIIIDVVKDVDNRYYTLSKTPEFCEELFVPFKEIATSHGIWPENKLHLYLKSSCQAFHYLNELKQSSVINECSKTKASQLFEKTRVIISNCIKIIANNAAKHKYFCTIIGSNTLAMLASFKDGQEIIFSLLKIEQLRFTLFSYATKLSEAEEPVYLTTFENALTVLINTGNYDLYNLLFNRILADSKYVGFGALSAITDTLVYLLKKSKSDLVLSSSQKLSYFGGNPEMWPVLDKELEYLLQLKLVYQESQTPDFRKLESHYFREQIDQYKYSIYDRCMFYWTRISAWPFLESDFLAEVLLDIPRPSFIAKFIEKATKLFVKRHHVLGTRPVLCAIPLPHFLSYSSFPEDRFHITSSPNEKRTYNVIPYTLESAFVRLAKNQNKNNIFRHGDAVFNIMLQYKWNSFVWMYFLLMYAVCVALYTSFLVGVSFSRSVFLYEPGSNITNSKHIVCLTLGLASDLILIFQEVRQMQRSFDKMAYFTSIYNLVDWATFLLPIATFITLITGASSFGALNAFTILVIWLHGVLNLRVFAFMGVTLETIIQLIKSIKEILFIMLLVIFAFTNAFMALLYQKEDGYFQEQFSGNVNYAGFNESEGPNVSLQDVSSQNSFTDVFKSFSILWFFIYGVWDPVTDGDMGDNKTVIVLSILFSFITILIFFNIIIAYMNSAIEEVKSLGERSWMIHLATVIGEVESLWCSASVRMNRKHSPAFLYYLANEEAVKKQEEQLRIETNSLMEKLECDFEKSPRNQIEYNVLLRKLERFQEIERGLLFDGLQMPEELRSSCVREIERRDKALRQNIDSWRHD